MPPKRQKHKAVSSSNANEPSQKNTKKPRLNPRKPAAPVAETAPSSESEPGVTHIAKESPASGPSERAGKRAGGANTVNTKREKGQIISFCPLLEFPLFPFARSEGLFVGIARDSQISPCVH